MKVRQVLQRLHEEGWTLKATKGSHRQFVHALKPGKVTLPGHPSDEISPGTWNSIRKQAGWK
ncbi:type II toxin-antitoxin system HicA family toxin [Brevifollis gellanilyticus]|uniref:Addiction module toxin, HicA family n=1 Tax=Brevifollis gellanilyticus TaxID=748831 RepID=A0A512MFJ2_9BACT|nr:addiction module toxin, HicA family [Brevifollis gellanilyticus]